MSKQSEHVKVWRKKCKERIIAAMGGVCCVCGYNKCSSSLALHHLDPSQKDFSLGAIRANPKSWEKIVLELKKCVLVCQNCHCEIHAGVTIVPENSPRFNEDFTDYKNIEKVCSNWCLICSKPIAPHLKHCSRTCAGRSKFRVDWDNVDLELELKNKSILKLAEELGCSDAAIHKRLKKLGLKK